MLHVHSVNGVAVSAQQDGLLPLSQHAMLVLGSVGYHDYEALDASLVKTIIPTAMPQQG